MTTTVSEGPIILIGYEYRLRLGTDSALFPIGCTLIAQVRASIGSAVLLATLSTEAGTLIREDDRTLEIVLGPTITSTLVAGSVVIDVVRTDLEPDRHLGFMLEIPVQQPVTRLPVSGGL
jgi:hypothetical protein